MIIIEAPLLESLLESIKNVQTGLKITHQIWREDNTLLGYAIKDDVNKNIELFPIRHIDIGQIYAELDIQGLVDYSISTNNSGDLELVDSIAKTESSLDIDSLKLIKIARMKNRFESIKIRPRVPITTGSTSFFVDGSKDDISNFQSYLDLLELSAAPSGYIKDADSNMQPVTLEELRNIITQIKQYGLNLYQLKWAKEAELQGASTIETLKAISIDL